MAEHQDPDAQRPARSVPASSSTGRADAAARRDEADHDAAARHVDESRRADAAAGTDTRADTGADTRADSSAETRAPVTDRSTASVEPKQVRLDAALDGHQRQGVSVGTWFALILGTIVLVLLLIFILQNNETTGFSFLGLDFSLPLGVAMLFAAIAGVLITALLGSVRLFKVSRRVRRLEKERETIKRAIG